MNLPAPVEGLTPKTKRLSIVALSGAAMAFGWALYDSIIGSANPVVVSTFTSLVMLVAGFYDHKNPPTYDGEDDR